VELQLCVFEEVQITYVQITYVKMPEPFSSPPPSNGRLDFLSLSERYCVGNNPAANIVKCVDDYPYPGVTSVHIPTTYENMIGHNVVPSLKLPMTNQVAIDKQ